MALRRLYNFGNKNGIETHGVLVLRNCLVIFKPHVNNLELSAGNLM